jgi:hypothetical protein
MHGCNNTPTGSDTLHLSAIVTGKVPSERLNLPQISVLTQTAVSLLIIHKNETFWENCHSLVALVTGLSPVRAYV